MAGRRRRDRLSIGTSWNVIFNDDQDNKVITIFLYVSLRNEGRLRNGCNKIL
ncbi:hypothetical cytosolic protein [Syntrophus aciditrophicus SB]|uniref:Hypothetical cytosolic protein n=1 Tax=Syntrophus aciditrophicus (strain SB) TaxID=56780 RepID=Q2LRL4_SYNAS|nr:hypothetical cytosolic protein [Syntrophus aciditrophicus SB]